MLIVPKAAFVFDYAETPGRIIVHEQKGVGFIREGHIIDLNQGGNSGFAIKAKSLLRGVTVDLPVTHMGRERVEYPAPVTGGGYEAHIKGVVGPADHIPNRIPASTSPARDVAAPTRFVPCFSVTPVPRLRVMRQIVIRRLNQGSFLDARIVQEAVLDIGQAMQSANLVHAFQRPVLRLLGQGARKARAEVRERRIQEGGACVGAGGNVSSDLPPVGPVIGGQGGLKEIDRDGLKMLCALIPRQHRGLSGTREILDRDPCLRSGQKRRPESDDRKRTPAKFRAIIVGDGRVGPITQVAPVRIAEKSVIPLIAADPAGIGTGQPIRCGNRVSVVEADGDVPLGLTLPA